MTTQPKMCIARHPGDGSTILIHQGMRGYTPYPGKTEDQVAAFNARQGATEAHVEAMLIGSMFGWDVPGAKVEEAA